MKKMKLLAAMFCAVATFAFTSCSKDYEKDIIGTWEVTSTTMTETYQGQSNTETEPGDGSKITFNEDHTYVAVSYDDGEEETTHGTYSIDDDQLTMKDAVENSVTKATIDIDGNKMTMTVNVSVMGYNIKSVIKLKKI